MRLNLSSCGNPDYDQNPYEALLSCENNHFIEVQSLEQASQKCLNFIKQNLLGSGNWSGGQVFEGEKHIANISYNGRIWPVEKISS